MKGLACFLLAAVCLVACSNNVTKEEVKRRYASAVTQLKVTSYYKVKLVDGHVFYFSPVDSTGMDYRFYTDEMQARGQASVYYATAFYVSDEGVLITSSTATTVPVNTNNVCRSLANQLDYLKRFYTQEQLKYTLRVAEVEDGYNILDKERAEVLSQVGSDLRGRNMIANQYMQKRSMLDKMYKDCTQKRDSLTGVIKSLEKYNGTEVEIAPVRKVELLSRAGTVSCEVKAENDTMNLAVLQRVDKLTPEEVEPLAVPSEGWGLLHLWGDDTEYTPCYIIGFQEKGNLSSLGVLDGKVDTGDWVTNGSPVFDCRGELRFVCVLDVNGNRKNVGIQTLFRMIRVKGD